MKIVKLTYLFFLCS